MPCMYICMYTHSFSYIRMYMDRWCRYLEMIWIHWGEPFHPCSEDFRFFFVVKHDVWKNRSRNVAEECWRSTSASSCFLIIRYDQIYRSLSIIILYYPAHPEPQHASAFQITSHLSGLDPEVMPSSFQQGTYGMLAIFALTLSCNWCKKPALPHLEDQLGQQQL